MDYGEFRELAPAREGSGAQTGRRVDFARPESPEQKHVPDRRADGGIGRHASLRGWWQQCCGGSSPPPRKTAPPPSSRCFAYTADAGFLELFENAFRDLASRSVPHLANFSRKPTFRAGLHAGSAMVAEIEDFEREIACMGDTVNTAARIGDYRKQVGTLCFSRAGSDRPERQTETGGALCCRARGVDGFGYPACSKAPA